MTARKKRNEEKKVTGLEEQKNRPQQESQHKPGEEPKQQEHLFHQEQSQKPGHQKKQAKTRTTAKTKKTNEKEQFDSLHQVAFWGLALLLFFPPYFRGLFFAPEQEKALIFATLVFWLTFLWRWLKRDYKFLYGPLDYFALALPVIYIISTFTAVNNGLAIDEVVKNILYFLTYWSASRLIRNQDDLHKLLHVIYISAIGVALAGLATATEIVYIKDGFLKERIYSTFQYPNALASYLGVVTLLGLYLWQRSRNYTVGANLLGRITGLPEWLANSNPLGYIYTCSNFLLLAVLLGTKSRGGLLVFGLVFMIYLVGIGARGRLTTILHVGVNGGLALICITKFIQLAVEKQYNQAWVWIIAGLMVAIIWQVVFRKVFEKVVFTKWIDNDRQFNLAFGALAGLAVVVAGVFLRNIGGMWNNILASIQLRTAVTRMDFVGDAIEMIKERPLLGWGGGGWEEAYHTFMEYLFLSNEVHSFYFQIGVEAGLLGLLAVAGIWISFVFYMYKLYHKRKAGFSMFNTAWVLFVAFMVIGGHALIDFDLSLSALTIVLWSFFGIIASMVYSIEAVEEQKASFKGKAKTNLLRRASLALVTGAAIIIFTLSMLLNQAHSNAMQASNYLQSRNLDKGLEHMEKAVLLNPYNADFRVGLSQIYRYRLQYAESIEQAKRAVELSPFNAKRRFNLADIYLAANNYEPAIEQAEKAVELDPLQRQWYEMLSERYFIIGYLNIEKGNHEAAKDSLERAAALPDRMNKFMKSVSQENLKIWKGPKIIPEHKILFFTAAAKYQLGKFDLAQKDLNEAIKSKDKNIKGKALIWQALVADKSGRNYDSLIKKANEFIPNAKQEFDKLKLFPILNG